MSKTMVASPTADDSDLAAAFAALRAGVVPLRPGFAAELRARLLTAIIHGDPEGTEGDPYAAMEISDTPGAGLRVLRKPAGGRHYSG